MNALIDHIAAVIIGASILLVVLALTYRTQDRAVEATQVELAKAELRGLVDLLEQDITNMGSGLPRPNHETAPSAQATVISSYGPAAGFTELRFFGLDAIATGGAPVEFIWRWRPEGTVTFPDGTTANTFEVERTVGSQTARFSTVTAFTLTLRSEDFDVVPLASGDAALRLVRHVDVALGVASPVGADGLIQESRWTKRFSPLPLQGVRQVLAAEPY